MTKKFNSSNENKEMLINQNEEIKHHVEELKNALKKSKDIPAWLVAKLERSATDLSDVTHYLEGESSRKMQWGGTADTSESDAPMIGGTMESSLEQYADGGSIGKFVYGSSEMLKKELANNLRDLQAMNKVMQNNAMPKSYIDNAMRLQLRNEELIKELKHRGININSILYKDYFKMANGGSIKNNDDYRRAEDKYHYYGALLMDAIEENNTTEITKLNELMEELETEINRYERNYKDGGKIKEVGFENSNLYLYGFGKDYNGNSIVKIGFPNQRAFSIQTNGVLNFTHDKRGYSLNELTKEDIEKIEKEVVEYVKEYGSKEQKSKLKRYSKYADGGGVKYPSQLKVGSIIQAEGFPMMKGLDGGNYYIIVEMDNYSATLVKCDKNGNKKSSKKVRHYLSSLEGGIKSVSRGDNNGFSVIKYADGGSVGEIEAKIADFRRRAENKSLPESAKNKFLSMAEELEKTLPKAEKKEEAKAEKPKFKVGDVVVLQGGDNLPKKITSIKENKKGEIIYSGYYESKPSEKFSYDGTELVIFKRPKKEPKEKEEKGESKKSEFKREETIFEKLSNIDDKAMDLAGYQSGGIQNQPLDKIKKYVNYIYQEVSKLKTPFGSEIYDVLEDENFHSLNLTLGLLGFYKNKKDNGDWAKDKAEYTDLVFACEKVKAIAKNKKEEPKKEEPKKSASEQPDCDELEAQWQAARKKRKEREAKRAKQGKPAELTPAETAKKAVDKVTDKIEAKAEKGKSVKTDITAVFSQFKSAVAELKKYKNEIDEKEVKNLIKELQSLLNK